jgi:DNA mismatch endonuclease (patch repair protein)
LPEVRRAADIVFVRPRVAVFVQGCWWHGCTEHWRAPVANREWWSQKVDLIRARDLDTDTTLMAAGWAVVRVWEHETPAGGAERVAATVLARRSRR